MPMQPALYRAHACASLRRQQHHQCRHFRCTPRQFFLINSPLQASQTTLTNSTALSPLLLQLVSPYPTPGESSGVHHQEASTSTTESLFTLSATPHQLFPDLRTAALSHVGRTQNFLAKPSRQTELGEKTARDIPHILSQFAWHVERKRSKDGRATNAQLKSTPFSMFARCILEQAFLSMYCGRLPSLASTEAREQLFGVDYSTAFPQELRHDLESCLRHTLSSSPHAFSGAFEALRRGPLPHKVAAVEIFALWWWANGDMVPLQLLPHLRVLHATAHTSDGDIGGGRRLSPLEQHLDRIAAEALEACRENTKRYNGFLTPRAMFPPDYVHSVRETLSAAAPGSCSPTCALLPKVAMTAFALPRVEGTRAREIVTHLCGYWIPLLLPPRAVPAAADGGGGSTTRGVALATDSDLHADAHLLLLTTAACVGIALRELKHLRQRSSRDAYKASLQKMREEMSHWVLGVAALAEQQHACGGGVHTHPGRVKTSSNKALMLQKTWLVFAHVTDCLERTGLVHSVARLRPFAAFQFWDQIHRRILRAFPGEFSRGGAARTVWALFALDGVRDTRGFLSPLRLTPFGHLWSLRQWSLVCRAYTRDLGGGGGDNSMLGSTHVDKDCSAWELLAGGGGSHPTSSTDDGPRPVFISAAEKRGRATSATWLYAHSNAEGQPNAQQFATETNPTATFSLERFQQLWDAGRAVHQSAESILEAFANEGSDRGRDLSGSALPSVPVLLFASLAQVYAATGAPSPAGCASVNGQPSFLAPDPATCRFPLLTALETDLLPYTHPSVRTLLTRMGLQHVARSAGPAAAAALLVHYGDLLQSMRSGVSWSLVLEALLWSALPAGADLEGLAADKSESHTQEDDPTAVAAKGGSAAGLPTAWGSGSLAWSVVHGSRGDLFATSTAVSAGEPRDAVIRGDEVLDVMLRHLLSLARNASAGDLYGSHVGVAFPYRKEKRELADGSCATIPTVEAVTSGTEVRQCDEELHQLQTAPDVPADEVDDDSDVYNTASFATLSEVRNGGADHDGNHAGDTAVDSEPDAGVDLEENEEELNPYADSVDVSYLGEDTDDSSSDLLPHNNNAALSSLRSGRTSRHNDQSGDSTVTTEDEATLPAAPVEQISSSDAAAVRQALFPFSLPRQHLFYSLLELFMFAHPVAGGGAGEPTYAADRPAAITLSDGTTTTAVGSWRRYPDWESRMLHNYRRLYDAVVEVCLPEPSSSPSSRPSRTPSLPGWFRGSPVLLEMTLLTVLASVPDTVLTHALVLALYSYRLDATSSKPDTPLHLSTSVEDALFRFLCENGVSAAKVRAWRKSTQERQKLACVAFHRQLLGTISPDEKDGVLLTAIGDLALHSVDLRMTRHQRGSREYSAALAALNRRHYCSEFLGTACQRRSARTAVVVPSLQHVSLNAATEGSVVGAVEVWRHQMTDKQRTSTRQRLGAGVSGRDAAMDEEAMAPPLTSEEDAFVNLFSKF